MTDDDKARLYRQIVQSTDDETVLERMRLLGFWPVDQEVPHDPPQEVAERQRIKDEIDRLCAQRSPVKDVDAALAAERKRRWEESKQRRAQRKQQRERERRQRRVAWEVVRHASIVHTGAGVSAGLQHTASDVAKLQARGLPVMHTGADLAGLLGIELKVLRWLTYHRRSATLVHYHRYSIAKKTGGVRYISAPKPALKRAQQWVLDTILAKLEPEQSAHGFIKARSVRTNALPHVNRALVINLDLKDFFPSVTFRRVKGLFHKLGYSEHVATVLALLVTEPPRLATAFDGKMYHVALGQRVLPQGACTSPALTNALCRRLDRRLKGLADRHGFTYTRYADDLTFSGERAAAVGKLLRSVRSILENEGFTEHQRKTKVMRRSRRQEVTGVTVNTRPTVSRQEVRELRAILHNVAKYGLESQNRNQHPDFAAYLRGRVDFVCMVDPPRAPALRQALTRALQHPGQADPAD